MGFDPRPFLVLMGFLTAAVGCKTQSLTAAGESGKGVVQRPELLMDQMKVQSYGPFGLEWEMTAPQAEGVTAKSQVHAENIRISFFQNGKKSTDLTAREGIVRFDNKPQAPSPESNSPLLSSFAGGSSTPAVLSRGPLDPGDMFLTGDVVVISTDGSKLTTDWLWFDKSREIIFSTAAVKVVRDDSVTNGIGLEATSNLSNVKIFKQTLIIKERGKKK